MSLSALVRLAAANTRTGCSASAGKARASASAQSVARRIQADIGGSWRAGYRALYSASAAKVPPRSLVRSERIPRPALVRDRLHVAPVQIVGQDARVPAQPQVRLDFIPVQVRQMGACGASEILEERPLAIGDGQLVHGALPVRRGCTTLRHFCYDVAECLNGAAFPAL